MKCAYITFTIGVYVMMMMRQWILWCMLSANGVGQYRLQVLTSEVKERVTA